MSLVDLRGKWALVTGAGTRVGAAIARELSVCGCHVVVHYATNHKGAETVAADIRAQGRQAVVLRGDLTDRGMIHSLAQQVFEATAGNLSLLVNNAANFERIVPEQLDDEAWDRAFALNTTAPYVLTLALREALKAAKGSMVAIGCVSAFQPWKNFVPYGASKGALYHLVRGLALALAPDVRVNAVAPGAAMIPSDYDQEKQSRLLQRIPLARFGQPEDVARAVRFLAENDYLTGHMIVVDGGLALM